MRAVILLKSHVKGHVRKDGVFVGDYDNKVLISEIEKVGIPTFSSVSTIKGRNGGTYVVKELVKSADAQLNLPMALRHGNLTSIAARSTHFAAERLPDAAGLSGGILPAEGWKVKRRGRAPCFRVTLSAPVNTSHGLHSSPLARLWWAGNTHLAIPRFRRSRCVCGLPVCEYV